MKEFWHEYGRWHVLAMAITAPVATLVGLILSAIGLGQANFLVGMVIGSLGTMGLAIWFIDQHEKHEHAEKERQAEEDRKRATLSVLQAAAVEYWDNVEREIERDIERQHEDKP